MIRKFTLKNSVQLLDGLVFSARHYTWFVLHLPPHETMGTLALEAIQKWECYIQEAEEVFEKLPKGGDGAPKIATYLRWQSLITSQRDEIALSAHTLSNIIKLSDDDIAVLNVIIYKAWGRY